MNDLRFGEDAPVADFSRAGMADAVSPGSTEERHERLRDPGRLAARDVRPGHPARPRQGHPPRPVEHRR